MRTLAIDIGGTKLAAGLVEGDTLSHRCEQPTPASQTPQALQQALRELVAPLIPLASHVAVASTGIIHQGVLTALNPANLGGLHHFPLREYLMELTGLPTLAVNDAQAAAWAEYHALAIKEDMAFLTVSTGVGGGVIVGGKLLIGDGLAGHLGHTLADPNGPQCGCGRIGCVEAIASGRAIAAQAQGELSGLDAKAIFARAASGNVQAQSLVARSAQAVARLIADIKAVTDCRTVIVGGSVGLAEGYLAYVAEFVSQQPPAFQVRLRAAHYRHDAGLLGAAILAGAYKA